MSNTRMPRTRALLTGSGTPPNPQSVRLLVDSDDAIPRGATGKVDVRRLRRMFAR
jgi:acyl-CoA synthetase (AMP-forming)/AMP-acid ligase II